MFNRLGGSESWNSSLEPNSHSLIAPPFPAAAQLPVIRWFSREGGAGETEESFPLGRSELKQPSSECPGSSPKEASGQSAF
jgi:hypothetical protein